MGILMLLCVFYLKFSFWECVLVWCLIGIPDFLIRVKWKYTIRKKEEIALKRIMC